MTGLLLFYMCISPATILFPPYTASGSNTGGTDEAISWSFRNLRDFALTHLLVGTWAGAGSV